MNTTSSQQDVYPAGKDTGYIRIGELNDHSNCMAIIDENGFVKNEFGAPLLFGGTSSMIHTIRMLRKNNSGKLYIVSIKLQDFAPIHSVDKPLGVKERYDR